MKRPSKHIVLEDGKEPHLDLVSNAIGRNLFDLYELADAVYNFLGAHFQKTFDDLFSRDKRPFASLAVSLTSPP